MTVATGNDGTIANWDPSDGTGLEDFDASDASMPRLSIDHAENAFKDSQTEELFPSLTVVPLGLVKGRIMWPGEIPDGDPQPPLCKSPDFVHGFPNVDPDVGADARFPWEASNYNESDTVLLTLNEGTSQPSLKCGTCRFKEWNTDPSGKRPWCSEEWTIPLLYKGEDGEWNPALFTVRRSGLKAAKKYITAFANRKAPLFINECKLSLDAQKRGSVKFSTPVFTRGEPTENTDWQEFRAGYLAAKEFLTQLPMMQVDTDDGVEGNTWDAEAEVVAQEAEKPAAKAAAPEPKAQASEPKAPTPPPVAKAAEPAPQAAVDLDDDDEPPF